MFAKFSTVLVALATASFVAASPAPPTPAPASVDQCNVSNMQCCNQVQEASPTTKSIIGLLGASLQGLEGQIGLQCSAIASLTEASTCSANPVCCTGNNYNGLIVIGCSPITLL